jgi:hypothetical protein
VIDVALLEQGEQLVEKRREHRVVEAIGQAELGLVCRPTRRRRTADGTR